MNRGTYKLALNRGGTTRKCVMEIAALKPHPVTIHGSKLLQLSVVNHTYVFGCSEKNHEILRD